MPSSPTKCGSPIAPTLTVFLQGTNLLDEEIRLHTSFLKEVAPLMGRSFTLGVRAEF